MKAILLTMALGLAAVASAQTPAPEQAAHQAQMLSDLATLLDLTPAQKPQVDAILQEQHAQMKQMFAQAKASGTEPDFAQMKAMHRQIEQQTLQKLTPVLTPEQLTKFQILAKKMHGPHGHGGPQMNGTPSPAQN
jgi:Spy/CpxP family protein refolding chaperone